MNRVLIILSLFFSLFSLASCERTDDIDEIFYGKTWYMNGGTLNGKGMNTDVKSFYETLDSYYIIFTPNTFKGKMANDAPFSGKWTVDGKKHEITLYFDSKPTVHSDLDQQIYDVLKSAKEYESGATFLFIRQDRSNIVMFGPSRNIKN